MTAVHTLCQLLSLRWDTPHFPIFSYCVAFLCLLIALVIQSTYAVSRFCPIDLCKDSTMRLLCSRICFQKTNTAQDSCHTGFLYLHGSASFMCVLLRWFVGGTIPTVYCWCWGTGTFMDLVWNNLGLHLKASSSAHPKYVHPMNKNPI